jgi:hypothetical protein
MMPFALFLFFPPFSSWHLGRKKDGKEREEILNVLLALRPKCALLNDRNSALRYACI